MAIHINLLHEQKTQQKQAERDPLKLGMLAMLVVAMLLGGLYLWKQSEAGVATGALEAANAALEQLKPSITRYEAEKVSLEARVATQTEVVKRIEERFFWAPAFEVVARSANPKIQYTQLQGTASSENVTLTVQGVIAELEPRVAADKLRLKLIEGMQGVYDGVAGEFSDLKDHEGTIKYEGKEYPAADFTILLKLNRRATPAPAANP